MNKAVVDASVAAKWVVEEEHSAKAALLLDWDELRAPDHWLAEVVNALWSKVYRGDREAQDAEARMATLSRAPVIGTAIIGLMPAAFSISVEYSITIYDALYFALARDRGFPLVTDDRKLLRTLNNTALSHVLVSVSGLA